RLALLIRTSRCGEEKGQGKGDEAQRQHSRYHDALLVRENVHQPDNRQQVRPAPVASNTPADASPWCQERRSSAIPSEQYCLRRQGMPQRKIEARFWPSDSAQADPLSIVPPSPRSEARLPQEGRA